jgi:hypothetical protein
MVPRFDHTDRPASTARLTRTRLAERTAGDRPRSMLSNQINADLAEEADFAGLNAMVDSEV